MTVLLCFQPTPRSHKREAALLPGEVPTEVSPEEERAQERLLRAVARRPQRIELCFHTHTNTREHRQQPITFLFLVCRLFSTTFRSFSFIFF